jgi:dTDP-4-dehydrorhamnose reductase
MSEAKMKILITGSDGLIGSNIIPYLSTRFDVIGAVEREWDILDQSAGESIVGAHRPDVLINLAAMTNVDGCEDTPELAYRVNADGAAVLAEICRQHTVRLLHFSTDYVFDGFKTSPYTEEDQPSPLSVYGKSKLLGEQKILQLLPGALIIRTEWIYGDGGENFITKVCRIAREKGRVEVVDDQRGAPTYAADIAGPVEALVASGKTGIFHVTNSGSCTWFEFAREVFSILQMEVACVPANSTRIQRKARRPANSVLDCSKLQKETGLALRPWQEALREYLAKSA